MKSKVYIVRSAVSYIKSIIGVISDDRVTVYAAQASFFVITSAVPFISLLIALISLLLPETTSVMPAINIPLMGSSGSGTASSNAIIAQFLSELQTAPSVSLLSFSAVTTLWTASKGISAIRSGIETVYGVKKSSGFVKHRVNSIITTLLFIVSLTVLTVLLLFGDKLTTFLGGIIGERITDLFALLRMPMLSLVMAVFFTAMYSMIASRSSVIEHRVWLHIPGGLFSSVGWLVFSYLYSIYIDHFPGASRVYGGLAAVCLIMLWLYFCMIILLLGAEINKLYFAGKKVNVK
ncbi:MAG: YihY/virulence factor BrkB family protein [Eubacteriales bacterium]